MLFLCLGKVPVVKMAEHDVDCADGAEIPVFATCDRCHGLHRIGVLPQVAVGEDAAEMVGVVLAVRVIFPVTEIGTYPFVCEKGIALVHIGFVVLISHESIALNQGSGWIFIQESFLART